MFPRGGMFACAVGAAGQDVPWDTGPPPRGAGNAATHAWREHPKISVWHLADLHGAFSLENKAKKLTKKKNGHHPDQCLLCVSLDFPLHLHPLPFGLYLQCHPTCSAATARPHLQESLGGPWALLRCPGPLNHMVPGSCWNGEQQH